MTKTSKILAKRETIYSAIPSMPEPIYITLWATDTSTGEDLAISEAIPRGGDPEQHVLDAMGRHPGHEFSGWEYA